MTPLLEAQIKKSSQNPGIYIFKNKKSDFLYIGKAANLRNRLKQYSNEKTLSPFIKNMAGEAAKLEIKKTDSEIEALILESRLIKKHQPKYNIMLRDGKQHFYIRITKEKFSKIFLSHQVGGLGPFTDGSALKTALRLLRRIFPYCTCKQKHNNFCLNYHIGKCLGYCCLKQPESRIKDYELREYKKNIKAIRDVLTGKKQSLIKKIKKELNVLAKEQKFEKAIELRNKIEKLKKIFTNAKIIHDSGELKPNDKVLDELKNIFKLPASPKRIEGYDISNIQGKNAVGAMVVFSDGRPDTNEYRKFKIRWKKTPDDIAMLKEILARRLKHTEWPYPDLIFIDGGIAQLNIAVRTTNGKFPIISLAKGKQKIFSSSLKKSVPIKRLPSEIQNLIRFIDSEAHRFAVGYYRKIHRRAVFQ